MEYVAIIAASVAGVAGGIAWARGETIKHLQGTLAYMRGEPTTTPRPNGPVRIEHGGFKPAGERA